MKTNVSLRLKRSLIAILVVLFLSAVCGFGLIKFNQNQNAFADVSAPVEGVDDIEVASGMVLNQSASIRLTGNAIRFSTTVTKGWHNSVTTGAVEAVYFATINKVGDDSFVKAVAFTENGPSFAGDALDSEEYTFYTYLNFGNASEEVLAEALTTEFESAVYLRVTRPSSTEGSSENEVVFYKAQNSNEVERSMRATANNAWLNYEEGVGYTKEDLLDMGYFTPTFRSEDDYAVVSTDNTLYANIPGAPEQISAIYVDDVKVGESYTVANFAGEGKYVTVFDENGKAYSTTFGTGYTIIVDKDAFTSAFRVSRIEGKYALINDINLGAWAGTTNVLAGEFNGLGHEITNVNTTGTYAGIFSSSDSATVKNISVFHNGTWQSNGALLFGNMQTGTNAAPTLTTLKNVVLYAPKTGSNSGLLAGVLRRGNDINCENCAFIVGKIGDSTLNGVIININDGPNGAANPASVVSCTNTVYTLGGDSSRKPAIAPAYVKGATACLDYTALYNATVDGAIKLPEGTFESFEEKNILTILTNENITKLQTATVGEWVLAEDIDMSKHMNPSINGATVTASPDQWNPTATFSGVLDGNGYSFKNILFNYGKDYAGVFHKLTGATIKNCGFEMHSTNNRGGIAGQIVGSPQTLFENVVVRCDKAIGSTGAVFSAVTQGAGFKVKDSIVVLGASDNGRVLVGGQSTNARPVVENVVIVNKSAFPLVQRVIENFSETNPYYVANTSGKEAVDGKEYFLYSTVEAMYKELQKETPAFTLPESVIDLAYHTDVLHELNKSNIKDLMSAQGCGYWFFTSDVDMTEAGITSWVYSSGVSVSASTWNSGGYWNTYNYSAYANIEIDGQGHKVSNFAFSGSATTNGLLSGGYGGTMKNLRIHFKGGAGMTYSSYLFGVSRNISSIETYNFENMFLEFDSFGVYRGGIFVGYADAPANVNVTNVFINVKKVGTLSDTNALFFGHNLTSTSTATFKKCFVVGVDGTTAVLSLAGTTIKDSTGATYSNTAYNSDLVFAKTKADLQALNSGSDWSYILSEKYAGVTDLNYEYFGVCYYHMPNGEWEVETPSNCIEHGTKVQYCVRCGEVAITEQIEELGPHTPGEWVVTEESTCTEHGTQVKKCLICSEYIEGTESQAPLADHIGGEWEVITEATCGEAGIKVLKCIACAYVMETKIIDATGMHVEGGWYVLVDAGCDTEGVEIQKCENCLGELARRATAPTREHSAGAWEIAVMPTKEQDGKLVKKCQDCDYIIEEQVVPKLDNDVDFDIEDILGSCQEHVLSDWVIEDEATCGKDGLKVRRCTTCQKAVETEVVPATLDHKVDATWDVKDVATCIADGVRIKHCTECGEIAIKADYSDPNNHKAGDWEVSIPATCAEGLDIQNCTLCGIQINERVSAPTGEHVLPEDWTVDVPATCVEGRDVKYCAKDCGTIVDTQITDPIKDHTASGVWETYISPSCKTTGTRVQKCTECDRVALTDENVLSIDTNAHVMGTWVVNAETGERERSCVICGEGIKKGSIEGFAKINPIAINKDNIEVLKTATEGYYYLTEDIDMSSVCANGGWNSSSIFKGTFDGRGYTLTNFQGGNGGYQGLFYKLGDGAIIKDLSVRITNVNYRVGFIGQVVANSASQVLIERVALYYENMAFVNGDGSVSNCASTFVHVNQADLILKDCFAYIAQTGKYNGAYTGYIFGGESSSVNPRVQNVHVMSAKINSAIGGSRVKIADINYNLAQEGKDYFRYSSAEQLTEAFANSEIKLPASVIAQMANLGVFEAHECVAGAEFVTYVAPTCALSGVEAKLCVTCGKPMETREISKLPHTIEKSWHLGADSTCSDAGYNYKKCLTCGEIIAKQEIAINENNHVNLTWEMVNGQMTGTCGDCGDVISNQMTVPTYHNDNTETFSIWAYGATPGKWISWIEDGKTIKYWLLPKGDGAVQYVLESEFPHYYYDEDDKLQRSEDPIWEIVGDKQVVLIPGLDYVTQDDAVYMTTTTENGTLDVYKEANFNTLFYTFGIDFSYADFEGSFAEQVFDWAEENGMKVIAQGGIFHTMASQETPLVDPVYGSVYTEGMTITAETKFKTQAELNKFAIYELRNVIKHPAFKGVTFIDEPNWKKFVAMGELAQAVEAAEDYYGQEIYVMINLLPYANSDTHFKLYNGKDLTGYAAYEYYLNTYYENVGKYVGYVQYDDYPLRIKGYGDNREIIQYYMRTHQFTSKWAKEKGIDRAMAVQSYGDAMVWNDTKKEYVDTGRRGCSPEDILWQMNISAAFGVKDFTYYTYFPIINTADGVDNNGEEFIVDRDGKPTKSYAGVQQVNAELLVKGKALMNFEYQDMKIFTAYSTSYGANKDDCYFFAGCGAAGCQECACINGTLKYVDSATVNFGRGAVLITELVDEATGYRGYYVVNITDPTDMISGSVTINISDLFNSVQIYKGTEVTTQALVNGQITIDLGVGDGALIIPYNA